MKHVPVIIAGGGPVGLTLAKALAVRGVTCLLAEQNATSTRHPKMDITNGRSMELFRRMGLERELRAVAVPEDHVFDVSYMTNMSGHELHRFNYPSVTAMRQIIRTANDGSMPREPAMRVSQVVIEPALRASIEAEPLVEVRYSLAFEDLAQDAQGVTAVLRRADGGIEQVRCDYVVGCDGGRSRVRACVGIGLEGRSKVMQRYLVHFRSDDRELLQRWGIAWHYRSVGFGTLVAQNDKDLWTLHSAPTFEQEGIDARALVERCAGKAFGFEIQVANPWTPHQLLAERYRSGRVLLAGDAVHQNVATGGYGMNTGIGDAADLAWKLAAVLQGFGGPSLLDSYDAERRPVGRRNIAAAWGHMERRVEIKKLYENLPVFAKGPEGDAARAQAGAGIAAFGNAENESLGIEFGYWYAGSPVICHELGAQAPQDPLRLVPTTVPGVRLPSTFLKDGSALFDRLGPWFTLLVFNGADSAALEAAAARRNLPLTVLRLDEPQVAPVYQAGMVLVRPDQHVCWRGEALDEREKADAVVARVAGWDSSNS
jgi:2-polyprenyl-6-methoxyphenol hydroxylase-like FAD-dependent oxidoreductase